MTILDGVTFRAQRGEFIGLIGPSGAGKSTLLYALSGFRPPHEGDLRFDGSPIAEHFDELKSDIGFVPQDDVVHTPLKVQRALGYTADLRLTQMEPAQREARVEEILRSLGIWEQRNLRIGRLSGGQRKRVSIAIELLTQPTMLFADEPTSGLDPSLEDALMRQLRQRADDDNIVVVTTHIMNSLKFFDKLCVLHKGHVVFFGPPDELKPYFDVPDLLDVYRALEGTSPSALKRRFLASPLAHHLKG